MGLATHQGPWLLGTVKVTTGPLTTAGAQAGLNRNTGATIVAQSKAINYNDASASYAFTIPAGSLITGIQIIQTQKFTSGTAGTVTVNLNGTAAAVVTVTGTGANTQLAVIPTSDPQNALFSNVGSTDVAVTYTTATLSAGIGTLVVSYIVRNADGTAVPASG